MKKKIAEKCWKCHWFDGTDCDNESKDCTFKPDPNYDEEKGEYKPILPEGISDLYEW